MNKVEKIENNLTIVQEQINRFDNKASILISIISIVFAISLNMINGFSQILVLPHTENILHTKFILLIVFSVIYFISFAFTMLFLISVIYPRKKDKDKMISCLYYMDIADMNKDALSNELDKDDSDSLIDQLIMNAKICKKKHKKIVLSIWCMIPLFISMFAIFLVTIC